MRRHTSTAKGLSKPHKNEAARPGIGSSMSNAKSIDTERTPKAKAGSGGLPSTYFGNADACASTDRAKK
jgi:hypothetical protein